MQVGIFNALDILLLFILFIGLLVGFVRGAAPQIISFFSIWGGLVLALWLYKPFSNNILQGLNLPKTGSDTFAFIILLIVMFHAVRLLVKSLSASRDKAGKTKKKKSPHDPLDEAPPSFQERFIKGPLNAGGGMVMGVILTIVWTAIILGIVQFSSHIEASNIPGVETSGLGIAKQLKGSYLMYYLNRVLWLIVKSVDIFISEDANILRKVVSTITFSGG